MSDYNLGTAHGKVVIDYDDRGSKKAASSLDDLTKKSKSFGASADSASKDSNRLESSIRSVGRAASSIRGRISGLAASFRSLGAASNSTRNANANFKAMGDAADEAKAHIAKLEEAVLKLQEAASGGRGGKSKMSEELKLTGENADTAKERIVALEAAVNALEAASRRPRRLAESLDRVGHAANVARTRVLSLAAAVASLNTVSTKILPSMRFLYDNLALIQGFSQGAGFGKIADGVLLMARAYRTFAGAISNTLSEIIGNFLGVRAVINGVPQEMAKWPRIFAKVVTAASALQGIRTTVVSIQSVIARGLPTAGLFTALIARSKMAQASIGRLISGRLREFPVFLAALTHSFNTLSGAFGHFALASDSVIRGVAQLSFSVVFAQRAVKSFFIVFKTLGFFIERFTWLMGAAGMASIAFLSTMRGLTTFIRGTGNAIKQLSGVLLLIPAAIFTIGTAAITAKVGMMGMGEAFKAAVDKSKDLDEATKNLAGSAKDLVFKVREVSDGWKDLQKNVQERMFKDTAEVFGQLSEKYLPALNDGMGKAAEGINHFMKRFADFALQDETVKAINQGFKNTGEIISRAGDAMKPFLDGLRDIGLVGSFALAEYSKAWEGYARSFSDWSAKHMSTGQLKAWMDSGVQGFKDMTTITRNLGKTIANTFRPFYGGSVEHSLMRSAKATEDWAEFMSDSGKGGRAVQSFVDHLGRMAGPWLKHLPGIFENFGEIMDKLVPVMERFSGIAAKEASIIVAILTPAIKTLLTVLEGIGPVLAVWLALFSLLRTLNWLRKGAKFLASPFVNAAASVLSFKRGLQDIKPAMQNAEKSMARFGAFGAPIVNALSRVSSGFETMALRGMYAADSLKKSFASFGESIRTMPRTVAGVREQAKKTASGVKSSFDSMASSVKKSTSSFAAFRASVGSVFRAVPEDVKAAAGSIDSLDETSKKVTKSIKDRMGQASSSVGKFGRAVKTGATSAMRGLSSAASGVLGVMGGPWGAAFIAAGAAAMSVVETNRKVAEANRQVAESASEAASAQRRLSIEAAKSGGAKTDETQAASEDMVTARLDQMKASAEAATGAFNIIEGPLHRVRNDYDALGNIIATATNETTRQKAVNGQARLEQQALGDALKATGMTMEEATEAFANGGPKLDILQDALRSTGSAGLAVIDNMGAVAMAIQAAFDHVAEVGPRAAALGAGMDIISDAASSAEEKLNALRTVLQSLGLMEDSNFDAAQATAESIRNLADVATDAATGVDAFGKSFWTATGELNPFNAEAASTQDKLASLRENLLNMDPAEAMAGFQEALPGLEAMRVQLGATEEQWAGVLETMGLTPESIETQIAIQGMSETEQQLWSIQKQIELQDGKTAKVKVDVTDEAALQKLQQLGWKVDEYDRKNGKATLTAKDDQAVASLLNLAGMIEAFALEKGTATLDADNTPALDAVTEAAGWIGGVDALFGEGTIGANNDPARGKVQDTDDLIASVFGMHGMGNIDADNSSVQPKVDDSESAISSVDSMSGVGFLDADNSSVFAATAAAESEINRINGLTAFVSIIGQLSMPALPSNAGTLSAFGATGGKFTGNSFNLRGYRSGGRHGGYRLPSRGPGTNIVDGFLALNHLGAPVARLDKDEWVINGKSSKKWNRLLAAINRDDPRLKMLKGFKDGGMNANVRSQIGNVTSATQAVTAQLGIEVNASQIEAAAAMMGQISSDEFAAKFSRGIADGLNIGSRDYFIDQGRQYSEQLGIVFGKAAQDANDRLQAEIDAIEDNNLKEQKRSLLKSTEELQDIADREMMEWVNNNQFEVMGYTMAQSFAQGVSSGQNLLSAGVGALAQAATLALSAAGVPGIVAGIAVTAIHGLFDAFSDPALWDDGMLAGIYKIVDRMLAGLVTAVLDVLRNLFLMIGIDLAKVPFLAGLYNIKDAANGASNAVNDLMSDLEALNKLQYKNLGKTGATTIDAAIQAQLGNRVLASQVAPAAASGDSGPRIGALNVYAPDDKAGSIIESATFEMKRF